MSADGLTWFPLVLDWSSLSKGSADWFRVAAPLQDTPVPIDGRFYLAFAQADDSPFGTTDGDWVSMAIPSDGSYGIPEGIIYSFPVTVTDGEYSIVQGLDISDFSRQRMDATAAELMEERAAVEELLG